MIFDLNIKTERFSIKIAPKHIIFYYSWDKKETNKLFRLVCLFWWERMDSNHRSYKQQIYSLSPLATRELSHIYIKISILKRTGVEVELVDGLEPPTC